MRTTASRPSGRPQRSLSGQAAILAAGSMFTQAATLLSLVVLTRLVAEPELGGYQQLWLIYGILAPFLVGGVPAALLYFLPRARSPAEERTYLLDAYALLTGLGLACSVCLLVLRNPIAEAMNNPSLSRALLFYAPYPFFAFLAAAMPTALVATGRARATAILNVLNGALTVGIVVAAAAISPTTSSMAAGLSISAAVFALVSTATVVRVFGLRGSIRRRAVTWRPLLGYGLPLALAHLAGRLGFQADRLVVAIRFTPSEFAVYALGAIEVPIAIVVQQAVNNVLVPALSRLYASGDLAGIVRQWQAAIRKTSLVMLPVFAFLMVMADSLITVLYGSKYHDSVSIFRAYLFLVPLRVATYGLIPQAIGRTGINLSAAAVLLTANVVLAIALVSPLGLLGPAIATPIATAITAAYYLVRIRGVVSLRYADLLPWRLLVVNLAIALGSAAPLLLLFLVDMSEFLRLALACIVFPPIYLAALRLTHRLTPAEWEILRARLPLRVRGVLPA